MGETILGGAILVVLLVLTAAMIAVLKRIAATQRLLRKAVLFERRFALYEATRTLLDAVFVNKDVSEETVKIYETAIRPAPFLLDENLALDLADLGKRIAIIRQLRADFDAHTPIDKRVEIGQHITAETAAVGEFATQLEARFRPFLDPVDARF